MKKNNSIFVRITLSLFLVCIFLFSGAFGCSCNDGKIDPNAKDVNKKEYDGTHTFTQEETENVFVANGLTDYKIVIPENKSNLLSRAKDEFVYLFSQATGIEMKVVSDVGLTHSEDNKYISIGETTLLNTSGVVIDKKQLTNDGVRIVTKDKTVFLCGGSDYGTIYSVYDFMTIYFDFECYFQDCFEIKKGVQNLKLYDFDVTDIPDLEFRSVAIGSVREISADYNKDNWKYRFRMPLTYGNKLMPVHKDPTDRSSPSHGVHNSLDWLDPSKWLESHPKWFATGGVEICYTAHGDEEELELMITECANVVAAHLKLYPKDLYPLYDYITLTCQDNWLNCTCPACEAEKKECGAYSGSVVKFLNRLNVKVKAWMEQPENAEYKREGFSIVFFAYHNYELAPVVLDEATNLLKPISDEYYLDEGVSVYLAPSRTFDFCSPIYAEINDDGRKNLESWTALGGDILLWTYQTNFWHYFYPIDTFAFYYQDAFEYFAANNVVLMFNQNQGNQFGGSTAWHSLKAYLDYKLQWDSSLDAGVLIDKYMNAMFGEAAPYMNELYRQMHMQVSYVNSLQEGFALVIITGHVDKAEYWPYLMVNKWLDICDQAYQSIEKYKETDPVLYEKYKRHIDLEWLSPAYMMITLHGSVAPVEKLSQIKSNFIKIVDYYGITQVNENVTITGFLNSL